MAPGRTVKVLLLFSCLLQRVALAEVRLADKNGGEQERTPSHKTAGSPSVEEQPADGVDPSTDNNPPNTDSKTVGLSEREAVQPSKGPGGGRRGGDPEGQTVQQRDEAKEKRGEEESEPGRDREGGEGPEASVQPTEVEPDEKVAQDKSVEEGGKEEEKERKEEEEEGEKEEKEEEEEGEKEEKGEDEEKEEEEDGSSLFSSDHHSPADGYTVPMTRQETRSDSLGMEETQEEEEEKELREDQMGVEEKKVESGWKQDSLAVGSDEAALEMDKGQTGVPDAPVAEKENQENDEEEGYIQEEAAEPLEDIYAEGVQLVAKSDLQKKLKGYELIESAAAAGNSRAQEELAYAHMFGTVLKRNFTKSFEIFSSLANKGSSIGQQGLGFMYSTGIGVNSSQAKAVLHYTFAALGGHHFAQMAMGYRSMMGISVIQSCEAALTYYRKAAEKAADEVTLITGGLMLPKVRLMEEDNEATNVYGVSEGDMIHYHSVFADSGNTGAQVLLGVYYMYGLAGAERNFKMALNFLQHAAREGVASAYALIGKIYAEGSSEVPQDYETALDNFKKAKELNNADGYSGIGMMYLYGMGVRKDYGTALEYLQKASDKGSAEGQYFLGHIYYNGLGVQRNLNKALRYFQLASHGGHMLGLFYLAEMHSEGIGVKRNCNYAAGLFKGVAERGKWTYIMGEAERSYMAGDLDAALIIYLLLAEMGLEVAQTNAAYILEQNDVTLVQHKESLKRALVLWNRSASQGYSTARVKLGDYYYYGQGTAVNYEAAAGQYRISSDKQSSAQAMFNLAYMYEQGLGLQRDYYLAKRYYDMAADSSSEAHVPVLLALFKLNLLYYYDTYLAVVGTVNSVAGKDWDLYLLSLLSGLLVVAVVWHCNRHRH